MKPEDSTERKLADRAAQEMAEQYRQLFEQMISGVLICEVICDEAGRAVDHRFVAANPACEKLAGLGVAELIGKTGASAPSLWPPAIRERLYRVALTGEPIAYERFNEFLHCSYEIRVFSPRRGQFAIVFNDITERLRGDEALRNSERFLLESQAVGRIGSYVLDLDARTWQGSSVLGEILGIDAAGPHPVAEWLAVVHPEWRERMAQHLRETVLRDHRNFEAEYKIVRPRDGAERWVVGLGRLEFGPQGRPLRMLGTIQDITERKAGEEALRDREERYRQLFQTESDAIFLVDCLTCQLVEANNAALRLYGYRQEEILRLRTTDLSTDPLQTQASIARRETTVPLRWHRKKDGTVFPVEITGGYFESGGRKFHVAAVRDLTEVKRTEKILKQTEEQFRQAQKMEAIGQLAGGVAHDFNNILAAVLMYLGLLQLEPSLSPTTRASLKELEKDVLRGTSLTRQLLAFSRRQAMEPKTIDVKELLQGLFRMLHRLLGEHIDLILQGPDDLPPVNADPSMLEQVVINLCVNARDAMPQGGKLTLNLAGIELSAETAAANAEARPGLFLRLSVTDLGCGMDAETRRHLFEPFFTTKGVGNGTGLGLATVHGIIKQHDGWIEVESAVGHGSTFQIYLPACEKGVKEAIEAPPPPLGARGDEGVLLVEDEDSLRQVTITALERHGYRVFGASTGPEALLQWAAHHEQIHLLITDMVMPGGMDGREVAERLRSERANLRVILCTGYTDRPSLQGLDQVAGTILLRKPFDIPSLLSALRASLDAV